VVSRRSGWALVEDDNGIEDSQGIAERSFYELSPEAGLFFEGVEAFGAAVVDEDIRRWSLVCHVSQVELASVFGFAVRCFFQERRSAL